MNFRPSHIPFDRLLDWVEDRLTVTEHAQLQRHLADCAHCRQEATDLARLIGIMRTDTTPDPPPAVVARTLRIFQPRNAPATPTLFQRIAAALQFDSAHLSPALGLRGGATVPRQLLFTAGDYDLDLRLTPAEQADNWLFTGQVLGSDTPTGRVRVQGATSVVEAPLSPLGEFVLPPIAAGHYTLVVQLPDTEITVDTVQVGS